MNKEKLSVIIPVYNVEQYLTECLDSVVNQSFKDVEIIIVDDGSTDNSPDILREYGSKDERIIIIRQENKGLSGARNTGIHVARGEYLCFVDSDDYLCDGALQIIYDNLRNGDIDVLCFNTHIFYETPEIENKYNKTEYFARKGDYRGIKTGKEMFVRMMANEEYRSPVWMMAIKRKWVFQNNIFFEEGIIHEDEKYSLQCYMNAEHMKYIDDRLYVYRIRENSLARGEASCHRVYSYMVSLHYMLQMIGTIDPRSDLYSPLIKYAQIISKIIRNLNSKIPQKDKLQYKVENSFIDMLFQNMGLGEYDNKFLNEKLYMKGFIQQLKEFERIIIYGAGELGDLFYQYLTINNLQHKAMAFAVTKLMRNEDTDLPLPIYEIDELARQYAGDEETLLIIAGGRKIIGEMLGTSENMGFYSSILLDETLKAHIRNDLAGHKIKYERMPK